MNEVRFHCEPFALDEVLTRMMEVELLERVLQSPMWSVSPSAKLSWICAMPSVCCERKDHLCSMGSPDRKNHQRNSPRVLSRDHRHNSLNHRKRGGDSSSRPNYGGTYDASAVDSPPCMTTK